MTTQPKKAWRLLYQAKKTKARLGVLQTRRGLVYTPAFIPVGTKATVKSLTAEDLDKLGAQIIFANSYHLWMFPGNKIIKKLGGLHQFSHWQKPIITDSGGFQVFSLGRESFQVRGEGWRRGGKLLKITPQGVYFRSHLDGKRHFLSARKAIRLQLDFDSDIILPLDDCSSYPLSFKQAQKALNRTQHWLKIGWHVFRQAQKHQALGKRPLFFAIIQGSYYPQLRRQAARFVAHLEVDGFAIGGVSVGEPKEKMRQAVDWVIPQLPQGKPRHLLGVGGIDDIFAFVRRGVDSFDCVLPTRLARMGKIMITSPPWFLDINQRRFAADNRPLDPGCSCSVCRHYSRAYLHHLFHERELLAYRLATYHNLFFYFRLFRQIRQAIKVGQLDQLARRYGVFEN